MSVWRDDSQQRRDEIMHWLRANGVTEPADRIGDSAYSRGNTWLYYETIEGGPPVDHGGPWKRWHRVELRVPFADAMRDYREQYRPATPDHRPGCECSLCEHERARP